MKQLAQYQDGRLDLQEVPIPVAPPGGVLVRTKHSVISLGTERMKLEQAKMNLLQKARARPDQVRKVLETARNLGWKAAWEKVRNRLETPTPMGYSAAGIVESVDSGNTRFRVGDRVACGGAECAFHAEYIAIPDALVVPVPLEVTLWQAAYTTIASIALQGVRQADVRLGEKVAVIGQGLVGLLVTNLLQAAGARVLAVDVAPARRQVCAAMGAERVVITGENDLLAEGRDWTNGFGVDHAILCTATISNAPLEQAAALLRDRGRLTVIGKTKMDLAWKPFYEKELDLRFSRSYGPGRYDPSYEWGGTDYPIGYVRWTEQRNFEACLALMAAGRLRVESITTRRAAFSDALDVYCELTRPEGENHLGIILDYEDRCEAGGGPATSITGMVGLPRSASARVGEPVTGLHVVGAGNFVRTMLLPHLRGKIRFGTVVNQSALSAQHVATKFGFAQAATSLASVPAEPKTAVLIGTRHHLHARLICEALRAGHRHIFVEKPLCLTIKELEEINAAVAETGEKASVMAGFNRRFAPGAITLKQILRAHPGPRSLSYQVFPGELDLSHWYANHDESGGRIIGETCHFLDLTRWLLDDESAVSIACHAIGQPAGRYPFFDSMACQIQFSGGSVAQLTYAGEGDTSYPKETILAVASGRTLRLTNFQRLEDFHDRRSRVTTYASKGHAEEMMAWLSYLAGEAAHPLPLRDAAASTLLTLSAAEALRGGGTTMRLNLG
jgi:predicted dehydrogenase/NADPH:quinone reductase-like Zn-dependent oxidoreductase